MREAMPSNVPGITDSNQRTLLNQKGVVFWNYHFGRKRLRIHVIEPIITAEDQKCKEKVLIFIPAMVSSAGNMATSVVLLNIRQWLHISVSSASFQNDLVTYDALNNPKLLVCKVRYF